MPWPFAQSKTLCADHAHRPSCRRRASNPAPPAIEPRAGTAAVRRGSPLAGARSGLVARAVRAIAAAWLALCALIAAAAPASPGESAYTQAREIERYLSGYPKRAQEELAALLARADASPRDRASLRLRALRSGDRRRGQARGGAGARRPSRARSARSVGQRDYWPPLGSCGQRPNGWPATPARPTPSPKSARALLQGTPRCLPHVLGRDVDRHHGEEPGPTRGIARRAAGSAVAGRARRQRIPPLRARSTSCRRCISS